MKKLLLMFMVWLFILLPSPVFANEKYIGFYNGLNASSLGYSIGTATSVDKIKWGRSVEPLLCPRDKLFDSKSLNGPYPVSVGDYVYVYYAGYDGTKWGGIGLAVLTKDMKIVSRPRQPVLGLGQAGDWDDSKVFRPVVIYNPQAIDPNKKFVMFYTGGDAKDYNYGGLAYSPDGFTWTKYDANPIISPSKTATWDSKWIMPEYITVVGNVYYMAYGGYDGIQMKTGIATSLSLEGPWQKYSKNPVLQPRTNAVQNLIRDANAGTNIIKVSNSSVFEINEPCFLSSTAGTENIRVKNILDNTTLELYEPLIYNHTISGNATIKSMVSNFTGPNQLEYDGVKWKIWGSAWRVVYGYETTTYAESSDLDSLSWSFDKMPTLNYDTVVTKDWDSKSQENLKFICLE